MSLAIRIALELGIDLETIGKGIREVFWPGRLEVLKRDGREIILDGAHNPGGIMALADFIKDNKFNGLSVGFAVVREKNWRLMLTLLKPFVEYWHVLEPETERAVSASEISDFLSGSGISNCKVHGKDYPGFLRALSLEESKAPIVIAGSLYMLGGVRSLLVKEVEKEDKPIWKRQSIYKNS
jgi:dihydrofolate synthase/folylpolyglutamate synthase